MSVLKFFYLFQGVLHVVQFWLQIINFFQLLFLELASLFFEIAELALQNDVNK